jgi:LuxR family maltose regulon positive regulatory protein
MTRSLSLITTKLAPPRPAGATISRLQALKLLEFGSERTLTLLEAPAGYGKTTLLTQWRDLLAARSRAVAWISLDQDDDDPTRFLYCILSALASACPELGGVAALQGSAQPASDRAVVHLLINELARQQRDITIIIDDYHCIGSPAVHELLALLLTRSPPGLHMVIASRVHPRLPLAKLRAQDQLVVLDAQLLRFDLPAARALFAGMTSCRLGALDLRRLMTVTDGWPAGLQIAAIALRADADPTTLIRSFSGATANVFEYFTECVLTQIPAPVLAFLLRTSVLARLNASLCEDVSGSTDALAYLRWLEGQNLFIQRLDGDGEWFHAHPLFVDFLRHRLLRDLPAEVAALNEKASMWYAERALWPDAVRHALAANRADRAVQWVELCAMREVEDGNVCALLAWIDRLPQDAVNQRPRLLCAKAWALALTLRLDEARIAVTRIETLLAAAGREPGLADLGSQVKAVRLTIAAMSDDGPTLSRLAIAYCAELEHADDFVKQILRNSVSYGHMLAGRLKLARAALASMPVGETAWRTARCLFSLNYGLCIDGQCELKQGHLHDASKRFTTALTVAEQKLGHTSSAAALGASFLAELHYEWNELERAEDLVADRLEIIEDTCYLEAAMASHFTMAKLASKRGDFDAAHALLDRLERIGVQRHWSRLRAACGAQRVALWLRQGLHDRAELELDGFDRIACRGQDGALGIRRYHALARARWLLATGRGSSAAELLQQLVVLHGAEDQHGMVRLRVMLSVALASSGQPDAALVHMQQALALGEPGGMLRTFVDEGEASISLIRRLRQGAGSGTHPAHRVGITPAYLDLLLSVAENAPGAGAAPAGPRTPPPDTRTESLSERERALVSLVADGLSNKAIARQMAITPETVKWHLKNIYRKLMVTSRIGAVRRTQELGTHAPAENAAWPAPIRPPPRSVHHTPRAGG